MKKSGPMRTIFILFTSENTLRTWYDSPDLRNSGSPQFRMQFRKSGFPEIRFSGFPQLYNVDPSNSSG